MQIDMEPGEYRSQRPDGSWTQKVDKKLCRWLALIGIAVFTWFGVAYIQEGGQAIIPVVFGMFGFLVGGLFTLSLRSIDW